MGENLLTNKIPVVDVSYEAVKEQQYFKIHSVSCPLHLERYKLMLCYLRKRKISALMETPQI